MRYKLKTGLHVSTGRISRGETFLQTNKDTVFEIFFKEDTVYIDMETAEVLPAWDITAAKISRDCFVPAIDFTEDFDAL